MRSGSGRTCGSARVNQAGAGPNAGQGINTLDFLFLPISLFSLSFHTPFFLSCSLEIQSDSGNDVFGR